MQEYEPISERALGMSVDLVTGASGFIGSHLTEKLIASGRSVRLLLRQSSSIRWVPVGDVEIVRLGDWSPKALRSVFKDVDRFFHVAGVTHARKKQDFFRFHVEGTRSLLDACSSSSSPPRRIVLLSSLAAAGPSFSGRPLTEEDEPNPVSWYGQSKLEQERVALSYSDKLSIVIIRPPAIYGPRDKDFLRMFRVAATRGLYPAPMGGRATQSLTHVDDLVKGMVLAAQGDIISGSTYFISTKQIVTWKALGRILSQKLGREVRPLPIPLWIVPILGVLAEAAGVMLRRGLPLDRNKAMEGRYPHWVCAPQKAERDLGFEATTELSAGIEATIRWYRNQQWL